MSSSPPNYTEGVPIKISEKYKPPPEIQLPTRVLQQLAKANASTFDDHSYDFSLERKIISKSSEWISIRLRERQERQTRIHQRELIRQKQIEEEHKLKLNQVSYPSADEISSCDEDDEVQQPTKQPDQTSPTNFNTILLPTQATAVDIANYKKSHRRYASNSSNKIDFSFFESDTSPFDHLEMKSMNEMEMLAEVLGSSTMKSGNQVTSTSEPPASLERDNSSESDSSDQRTTATNNNAAAEQQISQISNNQQQQQPHYVSQGYANNSGYYGTSHYYGNFGVNSSTVQHHQPLNYLHQQHFAHHPQSYAVNYPYNGFKQPPAPLSTNNNTIVPTDTTNGESGQQQQRRNIPSIIQELNDELNNSQRRRNLSQSSQKETMVLPEGEFDMFSLLFDVCLPGHSIRRPASPYPDSKYTKGESWVDVECLFCYIIYVAATSATMRNSQEHTL